MNFTQEIGTQRSRLVQHSHGNTDEHCAPSSILEKTTVQVYLQQQTTVQVCLLLQPSVQVCLLQQTTVQVYLQQQTTVQVYL